MAITVESFNGNTIGDATYRAYLPVDGSARRREARTVRVPSLEGFPQDVASRDLGATIRLHITVLDDTTANIEQLMEWFSPGTTGPLVVDFDGVNRVWDARVERIRPWLGHTSEFRAVLSLADPRMRSELLQTITPNNSTSSPDTFNVTNDGSARDDKPRFYSQGYALKAVADAQRYKREIPLAWGSERGATNYPILIVDTWDHAAEVTAGRSLSSGDDIRVLANGVEIPRWDGGGASTSWDDTGTNIWINLNFSPMQKADLEANITATSPANGEDLEVDPGGTIGFPNSGFVLIGTEAISYHGATESNANGKAAFRNIVRGVRNTTAASHTAADDILWIQHRIQLMYGHTGAAAPPDWSAFEPMLDRNSSGNVIWGYQSFSDDANPGRSAQWRRELLSLDNITSKILAPGGSPDIVLNFEYQSGGAQADKPNANAWTLDMPVGGKTSSTVVQATRVIDDTLGLRYYGRDPTTGGLLLLDTEAGPQTSGTKNVAAPSAAISAFSVNCRSQVVVSSPASVPTTTVANLDTTVDNNMAGVTTPSAGTIIGFSGFYQNGSTTGTIIGRIKADDGTDAAAFDISDAETITILDTDDSVWKTFILTTAVSVNGAEDIWLATYEGTATTVSWESFNVPGRSIEINVAKSRAFGHRLLSMDMNFDADAVGDDGDTATWDSVTVNLDATAAPTTVFGGQEDAYFWNTQFRNLTTNQELAASRLLTPLDLIEIDVAQRAVRNLAEGPLHVQTAGTVTFDAVASAPTSSVKVEDTDGHVQILSRYVSETQGWVAFRLNIGWNGGTPTVDPAILFDWREDATNFIQLRWDGANTRWELQRRNTAGTATLNVNDTLVTNQDVTVLAAWDEDTLYLSIDGANFSTTGSTNIPEITNALMNLGSDNTASSQIDSDFFWAHGGKGFWNNAQAAALDAFGNTDPDLSDFPVETDVGFVWWCDSPSYFAPGFPRGPSVVGRHDQGEVFSDGAHWVEIEGAQGGQANVFELEGVGIAGEQTRVRHLDRYE